MRGPQTYFNYADGHLSVDGVRLSQVAEGVGTPTYCYSAAAIARQFDRFSDAFGRANAMTCFAVKANSNLAVLRLLAARGAGMDVVSEGELRRALAAGTPARRITYSGVGKTIPEIDRAIDEDIFCFNVESEPELRLISDRAQLKGAAARVALRINPDVDARTHAKIATGASVNKFGVPLSRALDAYQLAASLPGLDVCGVDVHIGSQIMSVAPFDEAFGLIAWLIGELRARGHKIRHVDLGGGLGVAYREDEEKNAISPELYGELAQSHFTKLDLDLVLEPGRFIVANAGALLTRVLYVKRGEEKNFLIVDAAMNDLIRPTLYDAYHEIVPLETPAGDAGKDIYDVVGPVCETGDFFAQARLLPRPKEGDLLAILSAGAYGAVQSNSYNSRLLTPEVMIGAGTWTIVRPRPTYEDLIGLDSIPSWLSDR